MDGSPEPDGLPPSIEATIEELVATHGASGLSPSRHDWQRIFQLGEASPVRIVNLLRFAPEVATPEGPVPGAEAYRRYSTAVAGPFGRAGGRLHLVEAVEHTFGLGELVEWDAVVVSEYPSAAALAAMWLDPEFIAAHHHRIDGVVRSQVLVSPSPG